MAKHGRSALRQGTPSNPERCPKLDNIGYHIWDVVHVATETTEMDIDTLTTVQCKYCSEERIEHTHLNYGLVDALDEIALMGDLSVLDIKVEYLDD